MKHTAGRCYRFSLLVDVIITALCIRGMRCGAASGGGGGNDSTCTHATILVRCV